MSTSPGLSYWEASFEAAQLDSYARFLGLGHTPAERRRSPLDEASMDGAAVRRRTCDSSGGSASHLGIVPETRLGGLAAAVIAPSE